MIVTNKNFLKEVKRIGDFNITRKQVNGIPGYSIISPYVLSSEGIPVQVILEKGVENPRVGFLTYPKGFSGREGTNVLLDSIIVLHQKETGTLDINFLISELENRYSLVMYHSLGFKIALDSLMASLSLKEQKRFIKEHNFSFALCEVTKKWYPKEIISSCFIDGKEIKVSREGEEILIKTMDMEDNSRGEHTLFWTKGTMPFYQVDRKSVSLHTIILNNQIQECPDCNTLTFLNLEENICETCHPGVSVENIFQQYSAKAERVFSFKQKDNEKHPTYLGIEL